MSAPPPPQPRAPTLLTATCATPAPASTLNPNVQPFFSAGASVTNHLENLDHVAANPNDPKEIDFSNERLKFKLLLSLILMSISRFFYYFKTLIFTFILKHQFILVCCSTNMQIHKKFRCQELFLSRVQTGLKDLRF
jgi:hypothetical protein